MPILVKSKEELRQHHEKLQARYVASGIKDSLSSFYEAPILLQLGVDISGHFNEYLKSLEQSNGPDRLFFERMLDGSWLTVCKPFEAAERLEIIKSCLQPVDLDTETLPEPSIERLLMILHAEEPALWKSCNGYFAIGMCEGEESAVEICVNEGDRKAPIVFQDFSDDYLRECLVWSWSFTPDQRVARNARTQIMKNVYEACTIHRRDLYEAFDQYAFITSPTDRFRPGCSSAVNDLMVWKKLPLVLVFDEMDMDVAFRNGECRQAYYSVPEIWENTEKLRIWLKKTQENGYPQLSEEYWSLKGIESEYDQPLKIKRKWFEPSPPERTLQQILLMAMRVLELDQAFFGELLITNRRYSRSFPEQP